MDILELGRETICGWNECPDCKVLRTALDEIEELRLLVEADDNEIENLKKTIEDLQSQIP
jgi:glutaredoxin